MTLKQKLLKNEGDLGKLIVEKALKSCPKSNKSHNLVTLPLTIEHKGLCDMSPIVITTKDNFLSQTNRNNNNSNLVHENINLPKL